jgi:hypothetical protein
MADFAHITRCLDLSEADIARAAGDREEAGRLLKHIAQIAKPSSGAPKVLLLLARMGTTACEWLDGELRIEVVGDEQVCVVEIMTELGGGHRERVFPSFVMQVPLSEFSRAIERVPHMISPLTVKVHIARRLVLIATEEVRRTSMPPPAVAIADSSMFGSGADPRIPVVVGVPSLNIASVPPERPVPSAPPDDVQGLDGGWGSVPPENPKKPPNP